MTATRSLDGRRYRRLRSAARAVGTPRSVPDERSGDPDLLALVAAPYTDVDAVHEGLGELLSAFEARDDRRAVFLGIYARMTAAVGRRIKRGAFADPAWVADYLVAFADRYRVAVRAFEAGDADALAEPWSLAFEAAERGDSLVLQDAMLGVNAHINYDLALALDDVGVGTDRAAKYADHCAIIDVIAGLVDEAQDGLADRDADGLATLDSALGRFDEWLTVTTIDECRDSAWRTAVAMDSRFRTRRRLARWLNDRTATGAAHLIRGSQASGTVHGALVDLEGSAGE
ncbi:DUF5995 family protein [Haloarcula onubensis]|uniref:DUF5995 family protein n=1 Tax=Haloarcula onubensis TaxID=2950539 RepID=A0ABU2FIF0_9EURY|nr:DUF5995 family protein [Halomicroarcula sp. S3CR25-11]MDS0280540.1 DUF5995 family protein [Halomicroarcula sp. S3CR25-11]